MWEKGPVACVELSWARNWSTARPAAQLTNQHQGWLTDSLPPLTQDAARPSMVAQHLPTRQQHVVVPLKQPVREQHCTIGDKSQRCACKAQYEDRWSGPATVDPTQPSPEHCSALPTLRLVEMVHRWQQQPSTPQPLTLVELFKEKPVESSADSDQS